MAKIIVIFGSTSTGKTDLALNLAKKFNGELVSCDSRQVYKKLDIGTGKLPGKQVNTEKGNGFWWLDGVKVWMYDVVNFRQQYTVYDYVKDADQVIENILSREKLPIIVGGTGLYLKALLEGLPNLDIPVDQKLRKQLNNLTLEQLQQRLQKLDKKKWEGLNKSDRQNPRRLIRAIEITSTSSTSEESLRATVRGDFETLKIGLTAPRDTLYKRIDERVISRINQGMITEAESLHKHGLSFRRMRQLGLEYGILADFLEGRITSKGDLIKIMQGKIHGYARRQITWFKKEKDVYWFDIIGKDYLARIENLVAKWYDNS
ncbi:tRNA (adenosine(37)-N6)-dimethylallyltransferase MiaA [Candidatus Daviesbacteria bacterium RIFCSPLOWO2_02_FULL_36_7]|uniref:tRNA dimethylallyltransferase n=1 Tax=Candidatus Daviesbacteria bacterium RIFCSPLOWO2_02_FULL_36_7 TaxID=1797792 RepID=A0A1F5MI23_9BACT|nr:MAG: tRNA (adenosine(37)-N6)-dimethylallyltransferase MiaA [Candidatus Daviesbacteria bacterium RIFCSPLOWO2_02_FULL_36_7]